MMSEETAATFAPIVTTLFLPPTLVTGVFGMNTKGLPLTDVETGFLWAAALMVYSSLLVCLIMRRIGIFKSMRRAAPIRPSCDCGISLLS